MDIAAAKKRCEAATDGWEIGQERGNPPYQIVSHGAVVADFGAGWKDIFFAVNARTDLPAALEALEEAQGKLAMLTEAGVTDYSKLTGANRVDCHFCNGVWRTEEPAKHKSMCPLDRILKGE